MLIVNPDGLRHTMQCIKMDSKENTSKIAPKPIAHTISNQWRPLIRILAVLGPYRLRVASRTEAFSTRAKLENPPPHIVAKFTWKNPITAYPHCLLLCFIFVCIMQAFNIGLDLAFPFRL